MKKKPLVILNKGSLFLQRFVCQLLTYLTRLFTSLRLIKLTTSKQFVRISSKLNGSDWLLDVAGLGEVETFSHPELFSSQRWCRFCCNVCCPETGFFGSRSYGELRFACLFLEKLFRLTGWSLEMLNLSTGWSLVTSNVLASWSRFEWVDKFWATRNDRSPFWISERSSCLTRPAELKQEKSHNLNYGLGRYS